MTKSKRNNNKDIQIQFKAGVSNLFDIKCLFFWQPLSPQNALEKLGSDFSFCCLRHYFQAAEVCHLHSHSSSVIPRLLSDMRMSVIHDFIVTLFGKQLNETSELHRRTLICSPCVKTSTFCSCSQHCDSLLWQHDFQQLQKLVFACFLHLYKAS